MCLNIKSMHTSEGSDICVKLKGLDFQYTKRQHFLSICHLARVNSLGGNTHVIFGHLTIRLYMRHVLVFVLLLSELRIE